MKTSEDKTANAWRKVTFRKPTVDHVILREIATQCNGKNVMEPTLPLSIHISWHLRYVSGLARIYSTFPARRYISKYKTMCFTNAISQSTQLGCRTSALWGEESWDNEPFILEKVILTC